MESEVGDVRGEIGVLRRRVRVRIRYWIERSGQYEFLFVSYAAALWLLPIWRLFQESPLQY
jgi:hypothetical protein